MVLFDISHLVTLDVMYKLCTCLFECGLIVSLQHAIEQAHRFNFMGLVSGMGSPLQPFDPINPCLILIVRRNNLVRDTLTQLQGKNPNDFKKPLKVRFTFILFLSSCSGDMMVSPYRPIEQTLRARDNGFIASAQTI